MKVSWTDAKRAKTLHERGLDFARAAEVFSNVHVTRQTHGGRTGESMRYAHAKNGNSGKTKWKDPDDAPMLTREFFRAADAYRGEKLVRRGRPPAGERAKEAVKLRISPDVLEYFRSSGPGWQTRINAALERAVSREKKKARA
jgi:uncharacterized protein (DUF4415 family)